MKTSLCRGVLLSALLSILASPYAQAANALKQAFLNPPQSAKAWCYWWWLNGAASKEGITRDFEEMKKQGIAGALLFDAGQAGEEAPRGPKFMSPEWRALYQHAVREADRLGIVLGVNLCSGWNAGGPWVTHEHAAKKLVGSSTQVQGPGRVTLVLPQPETVQGFYRDVAVLACPGPSTAVWDRRRAVDITKFMDSKGRLSWDVPAGTWSVLRIGSTLHGNLIKLVGSGPEGLEIDPMSAAAMEAHFAQTGAKLIADAGPLAGKALRYFHIDSWELGQPTWTPAMRQEFQRRRGYDPLPYLPALLKRTVDSPALTERFLADYRRTAADLVAANYYGRLRELTVRGGLRGTHPESGGPFFTHWIDALQCEGINDIPMGEFWKRNAEPGGPIGWPPQTNPTVKQAACAAHIYGKPVCQAEAFTSFADDWIDDPWSMKDIGDEAFCHGLTRNVLCFYVHQPRLDIKPGFQWAHVGTHFDRNITWWDLSHAWLTYLARCQYLLRRGLFVADFAYFQGEEVPAFIPPRNGPLPPRPVGFDHDVVNAEVLLTRATAEDGRLTLPAGMSYRYLVLPQRAPLLISPPVLRKLKELVVDGVTVIGPRPDQSPGLVDYPRSDEEVKKLGDELWGQEKAPSGQRRLGKGRILWGRPLEEIVRADALSADVAFRKMTPQAWLDWIHRRDGEWDIYFLSNQAATPATVEGVFRVHGKQPELWDAVTGAIRPLPQWHEESQGTAVPLEFAPRQSWFLVFERRTEGHSSKESKNFPGLKILTQIDGPWDVSFAAKWGGPPLVRFDKLEDWISRPEEGIKHYSGTAVYRKQFRLSDPLPLGRLFLDLGTVKNLARVQMNGRELGVIWTAPWRTEITEAVQAGNNDLVIEVVNLWPNRLIGDALRPKDQRFTVTNVRTYDTMTSGTFGCPICEARKKSGQAAKLLSSGLLGPVTIQAFASTQ